MSAEPAMSGDAMMSDEPLMSGEPVSGMLDAHAWATATLTDVATGETFTIASLAGKPVFVEAMAIWCTNCRAQQGRFTEAFGRIPPGTAEYVVLTIEPSETADELARYKADRGFTGRYAVAGKALSKALEAEFGSNVLNAPSVPLIFISPSGEVTFTTGAESVDEIVARAAG
jgi:thiol-disulfide isomerase/thioredoxin